MEDVDSYKFDIISKENIVLIVLLITSIFLIYKNYQTPVSKKSFLIGIYLYILIALLFITYAGRYIASLEIINPDNFWKFLIFYLVMAFGSIFIMLQKNIVYNHIGFLLFLLAVSLLIGMSIKTSTNITQASLITAGIVLILTGIVFTSSEESLQKMKNWMPNLMMLLCGLIIINFIAVFFNPTTSTIKLLSTIGAILFVFIILSDTSRVMNDNSIYECNNQSCINYPWKSVSLILDYLNLFVNLLNGNRQ